MKTQIYNFQTLTPAQESQLAQALSQGAVAVFATDTVYGIGTGAFCHESVSRIYTLKKRPATQPLQLLVPSLLHAQRIARFNAGALRVARTYWPGGITLLLPPSEEGKTLLRGSQALGIRVPAHLPLLRILMQMSMPMASTSANLHATPVLTREEDVLNTFDGQVEYILTSGTLSPTASTVLDVTTHVMHVVRAGTISHKELARVHRGAED